MFTWKKLINLSLILFFVAFSLLVCFNKFNGTPLISGNNKQLQIYEWWHIECFEGGGKSRKNYLTQLSLNYEKNNPTQLFMVKSISADQLQEALRQNIPHLFSFSEQVAKIVLPYLVACNKEYNIKNNFLESATYNKKLMAIPFIASGYCYFTKTNSKEPLSLYSANNNFHSAIPILNGQSINDGNSLSSYDCYTKFVNKTNIKLLGTARDLFRIKNLENLGRFSCTYEPVSIFTDLVQYIGITSNNKNVLNFVDYVMSDKNQQKLTDLSLFSTKHIKLYTESTYSTMEQALSTCFVPNIFV